MIHGSVGAGFTLVLLSIGGCYVDGSGVDPDAPGAPRSLCSPACQNGGVCIGETCFCGVVDFEGPTCETPVDDCEDVDCGNGSCVDGVLDYACSCTEGWALDDSGACTVLIEDCGTQGACINGSCDDTRGEVVCTCTPGYLGTNCNVPVDCGAPPEPPKNAGGGVVSGTGFGAIAVYACLDGFGPDYAGIECQADATWESFELNCKPNRCDLLLPIDNASLDFSNGLEIGSVATYGCAPGRALVGDETRICETEGVWSGDEPRCVSPGTCDSDPCVVGMCVQYGMVGFECVCDSGWHGELCNTDIDECAAEICSVPGSSSCVNFLGGYLCVCRTGWTGTNCEIRAP